MKWFKKWVKYQLYIGQAHAWEGKALVSPDMVELPAMERANRIFESIVANLQHDHGCPGIYGQPDRCTCWWAGLLN